MRGDSRIRDLKALLAVVHRTRKKNWTQDVSIASAPSTFTSKTYDNDYSLGGPRLGARASFLLSNFVHILEALAP
jgi:hypothetical protein